VSLPARPAPGPRLLAAKGATVDAHSSWGLRVLAVRDGERITVTLEGELDLASAPYLLSRLLPEARRPGGSGRVVEIDVGALTFIDVAGIAALVDVATVTMRGNGVFRLRRPTRQLDRLIGLLGLDDALPRDVPSRDTDAVDPAAADPRER
jgi:anti-anti-sigma factor